MIQRPKGTNDLLPVDNAVWHFIEETARIILSDYQFKELRTPMFESYELFTRGVGETTDIVTKEMYDFEDKGGRHIALRPEGTASVVRAYVENKLYGPEHPQPLKVYYMGPMFRYERPQSGRLRQFHQIGVEVFGSVNPATDVEIIAMAWDFLQELGLQGLQLVINTLGSPANRSAYREALLAYLRPLREQLSADSQQRLEKNPLRVLDSKDPNDQKLVANAPSILDFLDERSHSFFEEVQHLLHALNIPFTVDTNMVRGLDYYQDTIFEIMATDPRLTAAATVVGGGRYDGLVADLGGPATPGVGFGLGMERLALLLKEQQAAIPNLQELDVYVASFGSQTNTQALQVVQAVRQAGYSADRDYLDRKVKTQFKTAAKLGAKVVLTLGEEELAQQVVRFKVMKTGEEHVIPFADIINDFASVYRTHTTDMTAYHEFFS